MADYDDYRMAGEKETRQMNEEYGRLGLKEAEKKEPDKLPVYLTDEARRAAELCFQAAAGCEYLLDYATTPEEKRLLGYAAVAMKGLCEQFGGKTEFRDRERFAATGVKRALSKTFLLCNRAATKLNDISESSGASENISSAVLTALCSAQSVMAVYLMQI